MSVVLQTDTQKYTLDNDYEINRVTLSEPVPEHTHQFVELVYTLSGKGVHCIDGRQYHVKRGDMLVINYCSKHSVTPVEDLKYIDIMLKPEYVNETLSGTEDLFLLLRLQDFSDLSNNIIKDNIALHFDGEDCTRIEALLKWTYEEQRCRAPAGRLIIYSALSMILSMVFRKMTEKQSARLAIDDRLLVYIKRNCQNRLPVNEIASECGYTAEHFSRKFRKYTGMSPLEFVMECRIDKAKELLLKTDKPIETVLAECGFTNRTVFFKKFSESVGITPLQFRKNQKKILL